MKLQIYQVDAFTNKLFGGNPAAVVPLENWLSDEQMQKIAAENNISETAFYIKKDNHFEIRWFTPGLEIDLCGHATLATAHILFTEFGYQSDIINFATVKAGNLTVQKSGSTYTLNFPSRPPIPTTTPPGLIEALGCPLPIEVLKSRDHMLVFESEEDVENINPDFSALVKLPINGVIVTSIGRESDFVSRFFIPSAGINEDPVTGSTHCNLIPYWADKLNKNELHAFQISSRRGELWCNYLGDRVLMAGNAVTYLKGEI